MDQPLQVQHIELGRDTPQPLWTDADYDELEKLRPWLGDGSIEDVLLAKSCYNTTRPIRHGKAL